MKLLGILLVPLLACAALVAACDDPTHDNMVSALGPEVGTPGPTHRPGQPCVTCHGGSGPGKTQFAVGGTVYGVKDQATPLANVDVMLTDANNSVMHATTNEVGNFYVAHDAWQPAAPIHVALTYAIPGGGTGPDGGPASIQATMNTHIGRDGSCSDCHIDPAGPSSPGHVYMALDPSDLQPAATSP